MKKIIFIALILANSNWIFSQITLDNPSFEGETQDATTPGGWHPCELGTTPDILPGYWGVKLEADDGDSYLGLITRKDGTWESVGQRLSEPMKSGNCFSFSLMLANSKDYSGYNKAVKLKIWGGKTSCSKDQLLGESGYINHAEWKSYQFKFFSKMDLNYIIFEAQYMDGIYFYYQGNILLDNCSTIDMCDRA